MFIFLYPSDFYPVFSSKDVPQDPAVSIRSAACLPFSSTFSAGGRISATQVRGVISLRDRMPLRAFAIYIAVCRKEGLFLFQPRGVQISSSFISYQETEANRLHHFCFYFSLSSVLVYIFLPFASPLWTMPLSWEILLFVILLFWPILCLCSTAAYLLNFACLKIIEDAAGKPAGSQKSHWSCEVCQETGNPGCTVGVLCCKAATSGKSNPAILYLKWPILVCVLRLSEASRSYLCL